MSATKRRPIKPPSEIRYFKKYHKPSRKPRVKFYHRGKKILLNGIEATPSPLYDAAYRTYPIRKITILKKEAVKPLPPPTPIVDVDPSVWLNYTPVLEKSANEKPTDTKATKHGKNKKKSLRTNITLEELTKDDKGEKQHLKKKEKGLHVQILDDELYSMNEFKKIPEGEFVVVLEETETMFLLEISSPQSDPLSESSDIEENALSPGIIRRKDKKEFRRKATLDHETQTLPPLMFDAEVATTDPPKKDFSVFVTNSRIYDGHVEAAEQEERHAEKEVKFLMQKLRDTLMDPNGHFKNDVPFISFYLYVMGEELKKMKYEEQLKIVRQFVKDYEEDPDIEELAKELDNDYDGFIKEVKRVRDEVYPPDEPEEDAVVVEPATDVEILEPFPDLKYEPGISPEMLKEILELDEFSDYTQKKVLTPEEQFQRILKSDEFLLALNKIENIFTYQKECDRLEKSLRMDCIAEQPDLQSMYNLDLLWEFKDQEAEGKGVNCIAWCKECTAVLATGYGSRGYVNSLAPAECGLLLIWAFTLPKDAPLCRLKTKSSVVSICFHPNSLYTIALGLSSGDVVIAEVNVKLSTISSNIVLKHKDSFGQAFALEWFLNGQELNERDEDESDGIQLIVGGYMGTLFGWKKLYGFLISECVLSLPKTCGKVKGIQDSLPTTKLPMSVPSRAAVMCIETHPRCRELQKLSYDIDTKEIAENDESKFLEFDLSQLYLVATDDGTVHQCYYNKLHYYQDSFNAHNGPIYCLSFNPFIERLFLTCGGDWAIRIWCLGIGEPLISLRHDMEHVECAIWSVTYSTIIVSIRRNELCIWDLARRTSSPVSIFVNPEKHDFTSVNFTTDGLNILTGDSEGNLCIYHLQDMPFISKFPAQHLVHAIKKALVNKPAILVELEDTGAPFKED